MNHTMTSTFADQLTATFSVSKPKAELFVEFLRRHGEVMVRAASGETWALHLGDCGMVGNDFVRFMDQQGAERMLFFDQIEELWGHRAHTE